MVLYSILLLNLSLLGLANVAQGAPPAWAGWPDCAFTCADGLGCKVPEDGCICVHNTFLACVTFALCSSDDADLTRDKWDALCTVVPPGPPSTSSASPTPTPPTSSTIRTTSSTRSTNPTSTPVSTPTSIPATPKTSDSNSPSQTPTASITESQGSPSSQPSSSITAFISSLPSTASAPAHPSNSAGVGLSPDGTHTGIELERKKTDTGAIVGGILGGLAGLGILLALLLYRKRLEKGKENAATVAQPILQDEYPNGKGPQVHDASHNPERLVAYEKRNAHERPQPGSPMGGSAPPLNQISPFDARPNEHNPPTTLENSKAQEDNIHGRSANVPSGSQEGAQPNTYVPRSSMEKGPDPFGDPSSQNAVQNVASSSVPRSDASPPTETRSMGDQPVDSSPLVVYAVDSAAGPPGAGPTMVYAMDSEVEPPPYIQP